MTEKLFVRLNNHHIYGYTELLAARRDAVVMTEDDVSAWRRGQKARAARGQTAEVQKVTPKKASRSNKPRTMVSTEAEPDALMEIIGDAKDV